MKGKRRLRVMAWLMVFAMVVSLMPMNSITALATESENVESETTVHVLNASEMALVSEIKEDLSYGDYFTITSGTKTVKMDASKQTSEYNHSFTQRLKMGGAGDAAKGSYRSIKFTTTKENAVVTIYALSSSNSADRTMKIYSVGDDGAGTVVGDALTAVGADNITDVDGRIPAATATLEAAGTYYICPDANINIYYVSVAEGETAEPDFSDGATPVVDSIVVNTEDTNTVDVTVSGTIANADTDALWVKLYNAGGELVDETKIHELTEGSATVNLTPTTGVGGTYTAVCEAIRGGTKTSYKSEEKTIEFTPTLTEVVFSSIVTNASLGLDVEWKTVVAAVKYAVAIKEKGADDSTYKVLVDDLTECKYSISNTDAVSGSSYTIKVEAFDSNGESVSATQDKKVATSEERFKPALVGSGASGTITVDEEKETIELAAVAVGSGSGGKLADSEDGFVYYYTEVDPTKENFELTATFTVIDSASKDNQSGFGVMAVDTFEDGNSSARYFNSAGCMVRKYNKVVDGVTKSYYGIPGGYFVTGYTGKATASSSARTLVDTAPFDWDWKSDYVTESNSNPPKFEDNESYTLTLKKDNTGFHAIWKAYNGTECNYDTIICYEPELLLQQDGEKYYVGVCASRKITVEVSNLTFTTSDPATDPEAIPRPITTVYATPTYDSASTASSSSFEAAFKADYVGTINVYDAEENLVAENLKVDPTKEESLRVTTALTLKAGENKFKAVFTPGTDEEQGSLLGKAEVLDQTAIEVPFTVTMKQNGTSENAIYVSATGSASNAGTKASPMDIHTAVAYAQPGQEIVLLGGTYELTKCVNVERGHDGTETAPITIMAAPGEEVKFDLSKSSSGGFVINGNYWHLYDFEVYNGQGNAKVVQISGHNNIVEKLLVHDNGYTGIQISGNSSETLSMWPSNNLVLSCESYNNCDPLANDADGFAAKLTCGEGNVFRYCISHHNIDDGWDLYAKSTTGLIGEVLIDSCVAYNNGYMTEAAGSDKIGEGNGFKLGGESMPVAHRIVNSISYDNLNNGTFSNSNPICIVENVTSYNNGGSNLQFNTNASETNWVLNNFISYGEAGKADSFALKGQDSLASDTNYIDGVNASGASVTDDWFVSLDTSLVPTIAEDGSIDMHGLLQLTDEAASGVGAVLGENANPTDITIGSEIGANGTQEGEEGTEPEPKPEPTPVPTPNPVPTPDPAPNPSVPASPVKETIKTEDFDAVTLNEDGTAAIMDVSVKTTKVEVPSTIEYNGVTYIVTEIADKAFYKCTKLKSVTIPDTVKTIGDKAFYNCKKLKTVKLPASVEKIGSKAFYGCKAMTKITLSDGVTEIGNYAFQNCKSLTKITIPKSVTKIGKYAFKGCSKLKKITVKTTKLTKSSNKAFKGLSKSKVTIKVPKSKKSSYKKIYKGYKIK